MANRMKPAYRIYAPNEFGSLYRIGRTYTTLKTCLSTAAQLSRHFSHTEVRDDRRPIATRLLAIARSGDIIKGIRK